MDVNEVREEGIKNYFEGAVDIAGKHGDLSRFNRSIIFFDHIESVDHINTDSIVVFTSHREYHIDSDYASEFREGLRKWMWKR
jgi:hypothetical protein